MNSPKFRFSPPAGAGKVLPFDNDKRAFGRALQRAEGAYNGSLQEQCVVDHCTQLKSVFEEEQKFSHQYSKMICAWKSMTELARNDIAATADYLLAIREHGDDEQLLARRSQNTPEALVAHFDNILTAIQKAADINGRATFLVDPSRKKDSLGNKSMAPLREFSYQLKLHWDKTMTKSIGPEFNKKFAFNIAHKLVFKAIRVLTDKYTELEVVRIIRSLQTRITIQKPFECRCPRVSHR